MSVVQWLRLGCCKLCYYLQRRLKELVNKISNIISQNCVYFFLWCGGVHLWRGLCPVVLCRGGVWSGGVWSGTGDPERPTPARGQGAKRNSISLGRDRPGLSLSCTARAIFSCFSWFCFMCSLGCRVFGFSFPPFGICVLFLGPLFSTLFLCWRQKLFSALASSRPGCEIWRFFCLLAAFLCSDDNFFICVPKLA